MQEFQTKGGRLVFPVGCYHLEDWLLDAVNVPKLIKLLNTGKSKLHLHDPDMLGIHMILPSGEKLMLSTYHQESGSAWLGCAGNMQGKQIILHAFTTKKQFAEFCWQCRARSQFGASL